jgi:hypothetical protein
MRRKKILDPFDWARHQEYLATLTGVVDIGLGPDALRASGLTQRELGALLGELFHSVPDGGASVAVLTVPCGPVRLYLRRRGKSLDAGTRQDLCALGWSPLCDLLDEKFPPSGNEKE